MPGKLLVVINIAATDHPCVERAKALAERTDAGLQLLAIVHDPAGEETVFHHDLASCQEYRQICVGEATERLEAIARDHGIDVPVEVRWAHPFDEAVLEAVAAHEPDMVFMQPKTATGHRFSFAEWNVFRRCPVPVWLARSRHWPEAPTVIAAVDPVDEHRQIDDAILEAAWAATQGFGGRVRVVHAMGVAPSIIGIAQDSDNYVAEMQQVRGAKLRQILPPAIAEVAELDLVAKEPEAALLDACEQHRANVLVLGLLARSNIQALLVGSTPRRVLARTGCDAILIKNVRD